jgi:cell division protein FtsX
MSMETELKHTLERVSETLTPTSTQPQEMATRGRQRRRIRRGVQAAGLASIIATLVVGFGLMSLPTSGVTVAEQPPGDQVEDADVAIFLCDGSECPMITAAQQAELAAQLGSDPDVARVTFESKQQAWERFRDTHADRPDLIADVDPDALPASFRLILAPDATPEGIRQRYADAPGVHQVSP